MTKKWSLLFSLVIILSLVLSACAPAQATEAPAAEQPAEATEAPAPTATPVPPEPTATPVPEVKDFITWYQFDQDNTDPASDEKAG
ncbi:MAG: hypothetical protein HY835_12930, partial [Anaerolineae bacterium]|nr:hypothetical protein [Anaerolineae bacterium]